MPDGYFEKLPEQVMQRISEEESRKLFLWRRVRRITSIAAGFALIIGASLWIAHTLREPVQTSRPTASVPVATPPQKNLASTDSRALAQVTPSAQEEVAPAAPAPHPSTRPRTASENVLSTVDASDFDETDYEILDFFSDDMADIDYWDL